MCDRGDDMRKLETLSQLKYPSEATIRRHVLAACGLQLLISNSGCRISQKLLTKLKTGKQLTRHDLRQLWETKEDVYKVLLKLLRHKEYKPILTHLKITKKDLGNTTNFHKKFVKILQELCKCEKNEQCKLVRNLIQGNANLLDKVRSDVYQSYLLFTTLAV